MSFLTDASLRATHGLAVDRSITNGLGTASYPLTAWNERNEYAFGTGGAGVLNVAVDVRLTLTAGASIGLGLQGGMMCAGLNRAVSFGNVRGIAVRNSTDLLGTAGDSAGVVWVGGLNADWLGPFAAAGVSLSVGPADTVILDCQSLGWAVGGSDGSAVISNGSATGNVQVDVVIWGTE